jgi:hypothetical protein
MEGAGGTPGGTGAFLLGLGMAVSGAYLLSTQVTVSSSSVMLWGYNSFGLSLVPFLAGTGLLFFNGRSGLGRLLVFIGVVIIFAAVVANLNIYFQSTSLFNTVMMLVLLVGGLGLIARAVRSSA